MRINSRFTVATHILTLLALQQQALSSAAIAGSVNTNPVVIRRILGDLSKAGLVVTQQGTEGGTTLARPGDTITLLDIYRATEEAGLFALHHSAPNPLCPCGRNIQPLLGPVFTQAEAALEGVLAQTTVAELAQSIAERSALLPAG
jgi:Rrf2 family protein